MQERQESWLHGKEEWLFLSRGPGFHSLYPSGDSQLSITSGPGDLIPFLDSMFSTCAWCTVIHAGEVPIYINLNTSRWFKIYKKSFKMQTFWEVLKQSLSQNWMTLDLCKVPDSNMHNIKWRPILSLCEINHTEDMFTIVSTILCNNLSIVCP